MNKMDFSEKQRIVHYLEMKVATLKNPKTLGKPLKGNLRQFWCYRVGDYRIMTNIVDQRLIIEIIQIGHRREIYH